MITKLCNVYRILLLCDKLAGKKQCLKNVMVMLNLKYLIF